MLSGGRGVLVRDSVCSTVTFSRICSDVELYTIQYIYVYSAFVCNVTSDKWAHAGGGIRVYF